MFDVKSQRRRNRRLEGRKSAGRKVSPPLEGRTSAGRDAIRLRKRNPARTLRRHMLTVERTTDAATFLDSAAEALLRQEARHNLMLGVADTAVRHPAVYPQFRGWIVRDAADVVGTAIQAPPFSVIVGAPARPGVLATLVDAFGDDSTPFGDDSTAIGGITGAVPEVQEERRYPPRERRLWLLVLDCRG